MTSTRPHDPDLPRAIGAILRKARQAGGWSRRALADKVSGDISTQTLASYELATRTLSVSRLAELCRALDISLPDLVARALRTAESERAANRTWRVDLRLLARAESPAMAPLRNWARASLRYLPPQRTVILVPDLAVSFARSLGVPEPTMRAWLQDTAQQAVQENKSA